MSRVFSSHKNKTFLMNSSCTDERNRLQLDTVKSILIVKTHCKDVSCSEFFDIISKDRKLLEKINSSCKFKDDAVVSSGEREKTSVGVGQPSTRHQQQGVGEGEEDV
jgi:hypothetical protein